MTEEHERIRLAKAVELIRILQKYQLDSYLTQARESLAMTHPEMSGVIMDCVTEFINESETIQEIFANIATCYAEKMTEEELDAALQFFESPVGQKYLEVSAYGMGDSARHLLQMNGEIEKIMRQKLIDGEFP